MKKIYREQKLSIIESLITLMNAGYDISLSKNSISVIEHFKSQSRNKWITSKPHECFGSLNYFDDGALRILANNLKDWERELVEQKLK